MFKLWLASIYLLLSQICLAQFTNSNLPIVVIETNGATIVDDDKVKVNFKIIYHQGGGTNFLSDSIFHYNGFAGIEYRGSSSLLYPKKSYSIALKDSSNNDLDFPVFGLPKGTDWALIANYDDPTHIKNAYIYDLWAKTGKYSPRFKHVEVVIDGEYMGLFTFTERIKRGSDRINIKKLEAADTTSSKITGGYIIEATREPEPLSSNYAWQSNYASSPPSEFRMYFDCIYPKQPVPQQFNYIQTYIREFEDALNSSNFRDSTLGFRKYVDENSFVENFVIQEYSLHLDVFARSQYFYKDRNQKLVASPLWDTSSGLFENYTSDWRFNCQSCDPRFFWAERMIQDCTFKNKVIDKYKTFRKTFLSIEKSLIFIDSLSSSIQEAAIRDREKWFPSTNHIFLEEIQKLKNFVGKRINWIDENIHNISGDGRILAGQQTAQVNQLVGLISTCSSNLVTWKFENADGTSGSFSSTNISEVLTTQTVTYTAICQEACPQYTNTKTIIVENNCPESLNFSTHVVNPPIQNFKTANNITSNSILNQASKISYLAGKSIELLAGFESSKNTVFTAKIRDCQ